MHIILIKPYSQLYQIKIKLMSEEEEFTLGRQNLIPFYIIEDRIKENFNKIEAVVKRQGVTNGSTHSQIKKLNEYNARYKDQINKKFIDLEKKIVNEINSQLQGRIIVAINKNMAAFTSRMEEKQKQISAVNQGINDKIDGIKKTIIYDVSKENQKYFSKESQKLQKKLKGVMEETMKKSSNSKQNIASIRPSSREKQPHDNKNAQKTYHYDPNNMPHSPQTYFNEQWVLKIKEMETKMLKFEQFSINVDKRLYQNLTSLKDSWKELGQEVLDTKRKLTTKQDELKLQLIKIKGIKQFDGSPENYEQTFKTKLMNKFSDIYQTISHLCSKSDLESSIDKIKKTMNRHDSQLSDIRQEMAKNNDYFTFYMNNSNQEDLSTKIKEVNDAIAEKEKLSNQKFRKQIEKNEILQSQFSSLNQKFSHVSFKNAKLEKDYQKIRQQLLKQTQRIDLLEDSNSLNPDKMAKIHNTLDINFTPSQQELLAKKNQSNAQNTVIKQLKNEINKLKDELFVINHEFTEIDKMKKNMTGIQTKLEKIKIQSEEAIISRKPWVCLSCDKQKLEGEKVKKQMSKKKLSQNRGGLFGKEKSDKLIKLLPTTQQKFQVYERYREKYLSDTVRLPQIYKQKIGDKQPL